MIVNKFSGLLGSRLLKMKQISDETGISRTTLTSIYNRRCKGIEFLTIDKLCRYLDCRITDIIEYIPDKIDETKETS